MSLHYNGDNSCLFFDGKEIFNFKVDNKNVNFPTQFWLGSISNGFDSKEISLKGIIYDFSVYYNSFDKSDISNTLKYLIDTNNVKQWSSLLNKCLLHYWVLADL